MTQKQVILVFPFELLSHYTRSLEICKILKEHFRVKIQNSEAYSSLIKEAAIDTFNCPNFDSKVILNLSRNFDFSWLNLDKLEKIFQFQVEAILEQKPSLVIGDNSPTLKMAAEKCNVPYVSLINGYMTRHYAVRKKIPDVHYAKKYQKRMPAFIFNFFQDIAENKSYRKIHTAFSIIRQKNKLSSKSSYLEELEGDLNLICDIPELFPQKTLPSNFIFIGPVFYKSNKLEIKY